MQRDAGLSDLLDGARALFAPAVKSALTTLDRILAEQPWLAGGHFTVADLNVAGVLSPSRAAHLDLAPYRNVQRWLAACYDRPAARSVRRRFAA